MYKNFMLFINKTEQVRLETSQYYKQPLIINSNKPITPMHPQCPAIRRTTTQYQLTISYTCPQLCLELCTLAHGVKFYQLSLTDQTMGPELRRAFGDVELMFGGLGSSLMEVVLPHGKNENEERRVIINVTAEYRIRDKCIVRKGQLVLEEVQTGKVGQCIRRRLDCLETSIGKIKASRDNSQSEVIFTNQNQNQKENIANGGNANCQDDYAGIMEKARKQYEEIDRRYQKDYAKTYDSFIQIKNSFAKTKQMLEQFNTNLKNIHQRPFQIIKQQVRPQKPKSKKSSITKQQPVPQPEKNNIQSPKSSHNFLTQLEVIAKKSNQNYRIQGKKITYIGQSNETSQLVLDYKMRIYKKNKFRVKVIGPECSMYIGVVAAEYAKKAMTDDAICLFKDGEIWDQKPIRTEQFGFGEGDIVEVKLGDGKITWRINGKAIEYKNDEMKSTNYRKKFLPFFELRTHGDSIQWLS